LTTLEVLKEVNDLVTLTDFIDGSHEIFYDSRSLIIVLLTGREEFTLSNDFTLETADQLIPELKYWRDGVVFFTKLFNLPITFDSCLTKFALKLGSLFSLI